MEGIYQEGAISKGVVPESGTAAGGNGSGSNPIASTWGIDQRIAGFFEQYFPDKLNPFTQTGAIANVNFLVAVVSGTLMLFWYSPSIHVAYDSLANLGIVSNFIRSLHRYSSDACIFFVVLHAIQIVLAGKFSGGRWLAWVTGCVLLFGLWLAGWIGYWLVWDQQAKQIALGTVKMLDVLPVFADPISRSFLTNDSLNSLFFFVIFFAHLLIPLGMGFGLWLHLSRLNKPRWISNKPMSIAVVVVLAMVSIIFPAGLGKQADMTAYSETMPVDYFYNLPLLITDRLSGGALWAVFLVGFLSFTSLPWVIRHKKKPSVVDTSVCHGCSACYNDCPYEAITMIPAADSSRGVHAKVNPERCMSCGVCNGACSTGAMIFQELPIAEVRSRINTWMEREPVDEKPFVAFVCRGSAAGGISVNERTGKCEQLPGYRVVTVPCVGYVNVALIEAAAKGGSPGVLIAGCGGEDPPHRLGSQWMGQRLRGERKPRLRKRVAAECRTKLVELKDGNPELFFETAKLFRDGRELPSEPARSPIIRGLVLAGLTISLCLLFGLGASAPYTPPVVDDGNLVISFKHAGHLTESGTLRKDLPEHLQSSVPASRERSPVLLQVSVDGKIVLEKSCKPSGFFADGPSNAVERVSIAPGKHKIAVRLSETNSAEEWHHENVSEQEFSKNKRNVLIFNITQGFSWH